MDLRLCCFYSHFKQLNNFFETGVVHYMVTELGLSASDQYSTIDAASAYRVVDCTKSEKMYLHVKIS